MKRLDRISERLRKKVRDRSCGRCQYCRFPLVYDQTLPVVDHIIARQHDGRSVLDNLAYTCAFCNRHEGANLSGIDPKSLRLTRLFNPRKDQWNLRFSWNGSVLVGMTPVGRTTVRVLMMNRPVRILARAVLMSEGMY